MATSLTQDSSSISASIGVFFSVAISRVGGEVVVVGNEKLCFVLFFATCQVFLKHYDWNSPWEVKM